MKTSAVVLLIVGLLIETAGFMADRTNVFSFVLPLIATEYTSGMRGVATLESTKSLEPQSPGFRTAAEIFKGALKKQNPGKRIDHIRVLRFRRTGMKFGESITKTLKVFLSDEHEFDWTVEALVTELEEIRQSRLTIAAMCIFSLGIFLQIVGFLVENRAGRRLHDSGAT